MRIVYFGTGEFAVPALEAVAPHVVLVVTQPDRPSGRGMKLQSTPVKLAAMRLGIPVEAPEKARAPEFVDRIRELDADFLLVASYGQILSQKLLDAAKHGGINLHGSILPKYRGAAPIQRAILDGEPETGITLMQMDKGMDSGAMIEIARTPIGPDETYGELQDRLALIAAELALKWLDRLAAGDYPRVVQNHEAMTLAPKVEKAEAELKVSESAELAYRRFRAFTPAPGPFLRAATGMLKIKEAGLGEGSGDPGTILQVKPDLEVAFASGSLILRKVQPEGKTSMSGRDFVLGARLAPGDRLVIL
jgi:methionyl-tRNA formyltransferase